MRLSAIIALIGSLLTATMFAQSPVLIVLSSNATKAVVEELGPRFEKATGQRIAFTFANSAELKDRIDQGEAFDVALLTSSLIGQLVTSGRLTAASRTDIARAGVGVAIKAYTTKPDVSTADALKGALVHARSIAYVGQGASAVIMRGIFEKFGLTEAMNAKTHLVPSAAHAVAAGEAELGFTQVSEILNVLGAEFAGPLPADLQVYTTFQAGVSAGSKSTAGAERFISLLTSSAAAPIIKAKGMEVAVTARIRR